MNNILIPGVFDLLHYGHIKYLNDIKNMNKNTNLIVLIHSDRYTSTYKRIPIINENLRLKMIQNIKCVSDCFIDDNDYLTKNTIDKYNINKVYQAGNKTDWSYYYHIPIKMNIMYFVKYNNIISTTSIISIIENNRNNKIEFKQRYSKQNILKSEKLYGKGYQSPNSNYLLNMFDNHINLNVKNILEIGCGLGGNCNYLSLKNKNVKIDAIDISKNMIEICKERQKNKNINFILSSLKNYNTKKKYDIILCRDMFMYLHTEQLFESLNKIKKLLSEGGKFILIDYCLGEKCPKFTEYCMNRNWNLINIPFYNKLLTDSGFNIIKQEDISNEYIEYFEKNNINIKKQLKIKLDKKINFLKNKNFIWHYFILNKK